MVNRLRLSPRRQWLAEIACGVLAESNYRRLPVLHTSPTEVADKVSIIVPARNEEARIGVLLESLANLQHPHVEIVVVDDASTDRTARVAAQFDARVVKVFRLPQGWSGKSHACHVGASASDSEWILFTDADTVHHPASLSAALALATNTSSDLVSLLCRQRCVTFWERLLLPYAYALYFVGRVCVNASPASAVANGQYMLIRRSAYDHAGGHQSVRRSLIEDVALARRVRATGGRVLLADGASLVEVRMYTGLAGLWEGFSKNSARFVGISPLSGIATAAASIVLATALPAAVLTRTWRAGARLYLTPAALLLPWMRRFGVPVLFSLLYPLAAVIFGLIALDSLRRWITPGATSWKGRRY